MIRTWTDSITRGWSKADKVRRRLRLAAIVALCALSVVPLRVVAEGARVSHAGSRTVDDVILLDADVDIRFTEEALAALHSGVALTIILEMEIHQVRNYVWDKKVAELSARSRLTVHALTGRYVLRNVNSGSVTSYRTVEEALDALGHVRGFPMLDRHLLDSSHEYEARLRARLDIESLPAPLRPLAYFTAPWRVSSDWYEWRLVP